MFERSDICARVSEYLARTASNSNRCHVLVDGSEKIPEGGPSEEKGDYSYLRSKSMKWHESMMAVMLVDPTWSNYSSFVRSHY